MTWPPENVEELGDGPVLGPTDPTPPGQWIMVSVSWRGARGFASLLTFRSGRDQEVDPLVEKIRAAIAEVTKARREMDPGAR